MQVAMTMSAGPEGRKRAHGVRGCEKSLLCHRFIPSAVRNLDLPLEFDHGGDYRARFLAALGMKRARCPNFFTPSEPWDGVQHRFCRLFRGSDFRRGTMSHGSRTESAVDV